MRKPSAYIALSLGILAVGFLFEPIFELGDVRWGYIALACFAAWIFLLSPDWFPRITIYAQGFFPRYDMPFDEAIAHCLKSGSRHISWGYKDRAIAQRRVARDIISEARKGKIRICGVPPGGTHPLKITRCKLKKLEPTDGAFPKSPETPEGYNWILDFPNHPIGEYTEEEDTSYKRLRLDSRDIFRLWPK